MTVLRARVVRLADLSTVMLYPYGVPLPPTAIVLRPATADEVYRTFYEETHCPQGHVRTEVGTKSNGQTLQCRGCSQRNVPPSWTWGAPSD